MQEATYHELAHIEHITKARVYAKHGMHGKAASHKLRAAHHASFGMHTRSKPAPSDRELRALKRDQWRERNNEETRREKKTSHAAHAGAESARGVGQTVRYSEQLSARGPDGAWVEEPADKSKERGAMYHLLEAYYDDEGGDSYVDGGEELPARSPARIGAAHRGSAPRRRESTGEFTNKNDAPGGADAGKSRPHSAPPSEMSAMAVTSLPNPGRVTCAITKQTNGARKCRKRTENDEEPESDQCLYEQGKGCVLNKNKVFCVLSEKRRNTCRRARARDIVSDEDTMYCKPDEQNLCQYISEESEGENESPESSRSEHTLEEAGSYAMTSSEYHRAGSGTGQTRQCILQKGGPMQEGQRRRCVFAAAGEVATYLDKDVCTLSESGKRCQLTQYAKGGGCMLSKRGRCKKAPRNYELTDADKHECKMYGGKCLRTAYETQRSVRRSLPVAPSALISRPVAQAVNSDPRLGVIFTEPPLQASTSGPLQASTSGRKRLRGGGKKDYEDDA
jgi:hypothetical protein